MADVKLEVTISQEEFDAVEAVVLDAQQWLQAAIDGKANACMERVINRDTNLQGGKLTKEEKKSQIASIRPAKRRNIERNIEQ